jgi:hypothetical protein
VSAASHGNQEVMVARKLHSGHDVLIPVGLNDKAWSFQDRTPPILAG